MRSRLLGFHRSGQECHRSLVHSMRFAGKVEEMVCSEAGNETGSDRLQHDDLSGTIRRWGCLGAYPNQGRHGRPQFGLLRRFFECEVSWVACSDHSECMVCPSNECGFRQASPPAPCHSERSLAESKELGPTPLGLACPVHRRRSAATGFALLRMTMLLNGPLSWSFLSDVQESPSGFFSSERGSSFGKTIISI